MDEGQKLVVHAGLRQQIDVLDPHAVIPRPSMKPRYERLHLSPPRSVGRTLGHSTGRMSTAEESVVPIPFGDLRGTARGVAFVAQSPSAFFTGGWAVVEPMTALTAVVGTVSGVVGAIAAARLTATMHRRSQHEHWRRDGRRAAYAAFVEAATDYGEAISTWQAHEGALGDQPGAVPEELRRQAVDRRLVTSKALSLVLVEGPEDVAQAAHQALRTMTAWACASRVYSPEHPLAASRSVGAVLGEGPTDAAGLSDVAWQRLREFETCARAALDYP